MNIERIFREESGRILATLIGLLGSFELAEEAMQEAFTIAIEQWPVRGIPVTPRAWLISTAQPARGDLFRRLSRWTEAAVAYRRALSLAGSDSARKFLSRRIGEMESKI